MEAFGAIFGTFFLYVVILPLLGIVVSSGLRLMLPYLLPPILPFEAACDIETLLPSLEG